MKKQTGSAELLVMPLILTALFFNGCFKPSIKQVSVAPWYGNARAAYSIIHDDLCDTVCSGIFEFADTIAFNRSLRFGAGAIVNNCVTEGEYMWHHLQTMSDHGHEIISHSWDHGAAVDLGWQPEEWSVDTDVVLTKQLLEQNIPGITVTYFIFPYDAYSDNRVDELKQHGYLGSRTGRKQYVSDRGVNVAFKRFDPLRNCYFDAYMSRSEQEAIDTLPQEQRYTVSIYNDNGDNVEIKHVDSAITTGGWSLQEMHSVEEAEPWGWGHISVAKYRALLDYVKTKVGDRLLWMDTPTAVIKYIMTKNACGEAILSANTLRFVSPDAVDKKYSTAISVIVTTSGNPSELTGRQNNTAIAGEKIKRNQFVLNINPLMGEVTLELH